MNSLVISLFAEDKPGIMDTLARTVRLHHGNWLASRFAHMAGQFAGFVEINVSPEHSQTLIQALHDMTGLTVHTINPVETPQAPMLTAEFSIIGNDKSGIVSEITAVLRQFDINIIEFDSECKSAPNWGNLMFTAECRVAIPESLDIDDVKHALEDIANDLVVDIAFKQ